MARKRKKTREEILRHFQEVWDYMQAHPRPEGPVGQCDGGHVFVRPPDLPG
ncbi:hypothetical protein [Deinococcus misasensis]|uniref:hypothetical protein n=1 Tax=Deinococcus misasensis TaxID=392413 RepID=UPI000B050C7A|nr:hypothetical protein [Deinococcus misasensis]